MAWLWGRHDTRWSLLLAAGRSRFARLGWWSLSCRLAHEQLQLPVAWWSLSRSFLAALQCPTVAGWQCQLLADQHLFTGQSDILGESHFLARQSRGQLFRLEGHQLQSQLAGDALFPEHSQLFAHLPRVLFDVLAVESEAPVER